MFTRAVFLSFPASRLRQRKNNKEGMVAAPITSLNAGHEETLKSARPPIPPTPLPSPPISFPSTRPPGCPKPVGLNLAAESARLLSRTRRDTETVTEHDHERDLEKCASAAVPSTRVRCRLRLPGKRPCNSQHRQKRPPKRVHDQPEILQSCLVELFGNRIDPRGLK